MTKKKIMNIVERVKAPTPKFFKVLRAIGLGLAAVGGTILATPIALPVVITSIGGYLAVVGSVVSAVSQVTTLNEAEHDCWWHFFECFAQPQLGRCL
jgi:hypothetical protein